MGIIGYRIGLAKFEEDSRIIEESFNINELAVTSITSGELEDPLKDHDDANAIGNYASEVIIT